MTISRELLTSAPAETEAAGERLARTLQQGDLLLLIGELGSGKTTLVRGLARGLGAAGEVASPSFQLVRLHEGPIPLAHLDLFRLDSAGEIAGLGLGELLDRGVVAVEWGDRLKGDWWARTGTIRLEHIDRESRRLRIESGPEEWSF